MSNNRIMTNRIRASFDDVAVGTKDGLARYFKMRYTEADLI